LWHRIFIQKLIHVYKIKTINIFFYALRENENKWNSFDNYIFNNEFKYLQLVFFTNKNENSTEYYKNIVTQQYMWTINW